MRCCTTAAVSLLVTWELLITVTSPWSRYITTKWECAHRAVWEGCNTLIFLYSFKCAFVLLESSSNTWKTFWPWGLRYSITWVSTRISSGHIWGAKACIFQRTRSVMYFLKLGSKTFKHYQLTYFVLPPNDKVWPEHSSKPYKTYCVWLQITSGPTVDGTNQI